MIIVRLLSPNLLVGISNHQLYSAMGADAIMESISLTTKVIGISYLAASRAEIALSLVI
jgi:hypothetical protein